jgi:hypothetical protein
MELFGPIVLGSAVIPEWMLGIFALLFIIAGTIFGQWWGSKRFAPRNNCFGFVGFLESVFLLGLMAAFAFASTIGVMIMTVLSVGWLFYAYMATH